MYLALPERQEPFKLKVDVDDMISAKITLILNVISFYPILRRRMNSKPIQSLAVNKFRKNIIS